MIRRFLACFCLLLSLSNQAIAETRSFGPVELTGTFEQGGMLLGKAAPGTQVTFDGRKLKLSADGDFVLGFGRDDKLKQTLQVVSAAGEAVPVTLQLKARKYDVQRVDGVPARTVNPDTSSLPRIQEEAAAVSKARYADSDLSGYLQAFIWPVKGPISGVYGSQRIFNGEPRRPHFGLDIAAPQGSEIHAPADGVVTLAHPDMFFSGATMVIDHGHGINTSYLHMSKMLVQAGDKVKQGQVIGLVGSSGRATGPHLCWRLNWYQTRLDPQFVVPKQQ